MKVTILFLVSLTILIFSGCAKLPQTREHNIPNYSNVMVFVHDNNISIKDNINVGPAAGIGDTTSKCFKGIPDAALKSGPYGAPAIIFAPIICPTAGLTYGLIRGAIEAYKLKKTIKKHGTIESKAYKKDISKHLQDTLISYMQENAIDVNSIDNNNSNNVNYSSLSLNGIDKIIEIDDIELYIRQVAIENVAIVMTLQVKSKLINTQNNEELEKISFTFSSNVHPYKKWLSNNLKLLEDEYKELVSSVASAIIDEYLLLYYPKLPDEITSIERGRNVPYYMLQPKEPELDFTGWGSLGGALTLPNKVYSPQVVIKVKDEAPIFKWEKFPWKHDLISEGNFSDVLYDFKIYQYNGICIYYKKDLKENWHKIEKKLQKDTTYLWTVRAKFNYNNQKRVTEWSAFTMYNPLKRKEDMGYNQIYYMPRMYNYFPFEIDK